MASEDKKAQNAFRTISEVADDLGVQQHVLRFWETKFSSIKPMKRGGGRRYYRPEDVALLKKIHHLLYSDGYTIKGVQKLLKGVSKNAVLAEQRREQPTQVHGVTAQVKAPNQEPANQAAPKIMLNDDQKVVLQSLLDDLLEMRDLLNEDKKNAA
ncbi:MAG: MerR family transcriptional regulator [Micavibrio aeruginosavorus]|uniref:MerR family transcriptional regulator n=1 Tax=Micavibrio aeruginosavorus TaxID=349221 RepID=A0A2W5HFC7_9BACT|nr:MAG: MerR family transcriptional regulator [Micavibrio aeruginosavorus]